MTKKKKTEKTKRPTALKRDLQNAKRRLRNRTMKSRVKTAIRSYNDAIAMKPEEAGASLATIYSLVDKAVKSGLFKKNKASRTKSRLAARLQAAG